MAMAHIKEPAERLKLRTALSWIKDGILNMKDAHTLDKETLKQYKIRTLPLSFDNDETLAPKFFAPYPPESMPEPTQDYVPHEYYHGRGDDSKPVDYARSIYSYLSAYTKNLFICFLKSRHPWSWHDVGYYDFGKLYQDHPAFGPYWIIHAKDYSQPHCKCIMYNGLEVDNDHLLRGEVLTVLRIMLGQLKLKALVDNMIAPVLLLSLNGEHPRILEAWFDGYEVIIRYTTNYDFTTMNLAGYKTFAQWFIGNPLGDTSRVGFARSINNKD